MSKEKRRVLVIDDSIVIQRLVQARLRADGFEVLTANNGAEGIAVARETLPDVILLDVDMPDMNGHETCRRLKSDSATMYIPVIFLTAQARTDDKVKGLDLGAIDYVAKPFDPVELRARVRSAYRTKYLVELLEQRAQIDGLTGLYNRAFFNNRLLQELERARRYKTPLAVVMLDVDRFKSINDTCGHSFGDQVLCEVAETARALVRSPDVVARYGGEEFVVILPEQDSGGAASFARRLCEAVEGLKLEHNATPVKVTVSLGVAAFEPSALPSPQEFVDAADKALYAAKHAGRNCVFLWEAEGGPRALSAKSPTPTAEKTQSVP